MPKRPAPSRSVEELRPHIARAARTLRTVRNMLRAVLRQLPTVVEDEEDAEPSEAEQLTGLLQAVIADELAPAIETLEREGNARGDGRQKTSRKRLAR